MSSSTVIQTAKGEKSAQAYRAKGTFETSNGTLYVSKPYKSKSSKKLRTLITFAPRKSAFDISNEHSTANEFRGFFSLFWISAFIFALQSYVRSIESTGSPLNFQFASMFSQDAITLAISDAVLVLSTGICVPIAKALKSGQLSYHWTGLVLQHILQTAVLFGAITWTFDRNWPWVQSGFLTLHSLVLVMKMHSYLTVNGQLQYINNQSKQLLTELEKETDRVGGWEKAMLEANAKRAAELDTAETQSSASTQGSPPSGTPKVPEGTSSSYVDAKTAQDLRRRLTAMAVANGGTVVPSQTQEISDISNTMRAPHPLTYHPDDEISSLANDYSDLQTEMTSSGPEYIMWPNNITWKNFATYMLIPSLVYELEYPRTDKIRPLYVFEKTVATFGTFALLYTVTESFILPYTPSAGQSFFRSLLDLALPFMVAYLLLFFIIFECICNGFAELSYFADRQFYEDWVSVSVYFAFPVQANVFPQWNSTSWDEFSRKWNKPVHTFLLKHVYAATILSYQISRTNAMIITFLLSACAHELVMAVVTKKFRMYLFMLQLAQIPLITLSRIPAIRQNKLMGNIVFWLGLYAGFPLLCVAYVAY